jgi:hypothetical protein
MNELSADTVADLEVTVDPAPVPALPVVQGDIFVFGSNELGLHGGGAARVAVDDFGARYERRGGPGQGFGPQGNSFAIPTCAVPTGQPGSKIALTRVAYYVECFLLYARYNPQLKFKVTMIGCGLAGWKNEEIAPLFHAAPANCSFDTDWKPILGDNHRYWGHVG